MAHSITTFRDRHITTADTDLMVFAELLIQTLQRIPALPEILQRMGESWKESLTHSASGAIDLELDEALSDEADVAVVCAALQQLRSELGSRNTPFSIETLHRIVNDRVTFTGERSTQDFQAIADRFCMLLGCPEADVS